MVEAVVAISLVGLGITSAVAALTKFNAFASVSRNSTGAYAMVMKKIDAIQSASPFDPAKKLIPCELRRDTEIHDPDLIPDNCNNLFISEDVKIYKDALDPNSQTLLSINGKLNTTIEDVSGISGGGVTIRRATVTVEYTYLNRKYTLSMSTLRASD